MRWIKTLFFPESVTDKIQRKISRESLSLRAVLDQMVLVYPPLEQMRHRNQLREIIQGTSESPITSEQSRGIAAFLGVSGAQVLDWDENHRNRRYSPHPLREWPGVILSAVYWSTLFPVSYAAGYLMGLFLMGFCSGVEEADRTLLKLRKPDSLISRIMGDGDTIDE